MNNSACDRGRRGVPAKEKTKHLQPELTIHEIREELKKRSGKNKPSYNFFEKSKPKKK